MSQIPNKWMFLGKEIRKEMGERGLEKVEGMVFFNLFNQSSG
jgi:hypothetical protein